MKYTITTAMMTLLAPFAFAEDTLQADPFAFADGKDEKTCLELARSTGETVKSAIAEGKNIVTLSQDAVGKAIEGNPECACEIIKEAVKAAQGSTELITSIVEAALQNESVPHEAILTCSLETAPEGAHSAIYNMVGDASATISPASSGIAGSTTGTVGAPIGAVVGGAAGSSNTVAAAVAAAASQVAASNEAQAASVAAVLIGGVAAPETGVASVDPTPAMSEADPVAGQ